MFNWAHPNSGFGFACYYPIDDNIIMNRDSNGSGLGRASYMKTQKNMSLEADPSIFTWVQLHTHIERLGPLSKIQ